MIKNRTGILILFLTAIFIFSGCGSASDSQRVPSQVEQPLYEWGNITGETITIWGDSGNFDRLYMTRAFERYQEITGNTVDIRRITAQEQDGLVPAVFASDTEEKPDILLGYGGTNIDTLNPTENFYNFTDAPWVDDLSDVTINQAIYDGKIIGFPHGEASTSGILYNKQIFKKFGVEIPNTQEEFLQVCETLLQNGITPMYLPYSQITMLLYQFPMDSFLTDGKILDGLNDGSISYADIPQMYAIVEWYKTMSDKGYFGNDYLKNDWEGMDTAMKNGQYAMMLCWDTWIYDTFTGDPKNIGLMPAFIGTPENGCFEGANGLLCLVNKNSARLDVTLDLINFMADPCNYNIHYKDVYTSPLFKKQSGNITTPQYMEQEMLIEKQFYHSTAWPRVRGFSQMDAVYIQDYMQNKCTIEECLNAMNSARIKRAEIMPVQ